MGEELVSCIMPTMANRSHLREVAIKCYESQDWANKELIIVEDEGSIGHKLNLACERAKGNILIRFDDDDWSAPNRITDQVNRLILNNKSISGYNSIYFWNEQTQEATQYRGVRKYSLGTALCFTRSYWNSNKFLDSSNGEDLAFIQTARNGEDIVSIDAGQFMIARLHSLNTASNRLKYFVVSKESIPEAFFECCRKGA